MAIETQKEKKRQMMSEINVTPFVDVMLVLLIIFMVTAPMMQQGFKVELPNSSHAGLSVAGDNPFIIVVRKNGKIFLGKTEIPVDQLSQKLKNIFKNRKDKQVYVQADKRAYYEFVATAMGEVRSAGLTQISLVTQFKKK